MGQKIPTPPSRAISSRVAHISSHTVPESTPNEAMLQASQGLSAQVHTLSVNINARFNRIKDRQRAQKTAFL